MGDLLLLTRPVPEDHRPSQQRSLLKERCQVSPGALMRALILALILLFPAWAMATPRSIHVEWGYTPPTKPAVTGFRLYQEGVAVHDWAGPYVCDGDATVDLTATITNFTLTATFSDGTESPHSAPFAFNPSVTTAIKFVWLKHGNRPVPMSKPKGVRLR